MKRASVVIGLAGALGISAASFGQEPDAGAPAPEAPAAVHGGSLFRQVQAAPPPDDTDTGNKRTPLASVSFIAAGDARPKKFKKHDLITITVSELSDSQTTGKSQSQKQQDFDLQLQQFLKLGGTGGAIPGIQLASPASTLPEIKFAYDNNRQNQAQQQRTDQFTAKMQAEIVDVKPNGNLVVEATKRIQQDKELQTFFLTGECRAEDVGPDNTVLSTQIANLTLTKNTKGEVKDGTRSGWFNSILDHVNPF